MRLLLALLIALLPIVSEAKPIRSTTQRNAFVRVNPCPATGVSKMPCPGYVVDHRIPLCAGGPDHPKNMQWQEYRRSLEKDKLELDVCRKLAKLRTMQ